MVSDRIKSKPRWVRGKKVTYAVWLDEINCVAASLLSKNHATELRAMVRAAKKARVKCTREEASNALGRARDNQGLRGYSRRGRPLPPDKPNLWAWRQEKAAREYERKQDLAEQRAIAKRNRNRAKPKPKSKSSKRDKCIADMCADPALQASVRALKGALDDLYKKMMGD